MNGFGFIVALAAALHLAALSFVFGPWHWKFLLVTVVSGALLWGVAPALLPLRRWASLLIGSGLALAVELVAVWLWRAKMGGVWWPLAQFASVHALIGLCLRRLRHRRPATFVWRGTMLHQRRSNPNPRNQKTGAS